MQVLCYLCRSSLVFKTSLGNNMCKQNKKIKLSIVSKRLLFVHIEATSHKL